ncbi:conserved hypothetical protein [Culex quinquefasciatus]|uniref:CHK kinase-like domain-containing protein n=1 Tax=Culex quinquefasciatus TaxID=7176 RepID=B0X2N3_CULQU|nr:conserved hypothetical protein [Culex quinquefasciatus]|eukprot:XP_001863905.1 conserved hypothetical protein [Culex quinquefasciatus]
MATDCEITWQKAAFFVDVVGTDLNLPHDAFCIVDLQTSEAAAKPAGFMSLIHRVKLRIRLTGGEERTLSYVVKEKSDQVFGGEVVDVMQVFPKEIEVYEKFIPAFEELWRRDGVKFGPRVFKTTTSPFTVIVMEDLRKDNFTVKESHEGLSLKDCERTIQKLAQFHAASVVFFEQNEFHADEFMKGMFSDSFIDIFEPFFAPLLNSYLHALEELQYPTDILEAIRRYKGKIYSAVSKLYHSDACKFKVLNHGDPWVNNIQLNDEDVRLVDYQIAFYGSPSFDLLYFITTSASNEIRTSKFDHLIECYHHNLVEGLQRLSSKSTAPTLQELHEDIRAHGLLMCALSMEGAMMALVPDKNLELMCDGTSAGKAYRRKSYAEPRVVAMLEQLVPFMRDRGFLK